jgi:hypothetical protein
VISFHAVKTPEISEKSLSQIVKESTNKSKTEHTSIVVVGEGSVRWRHGLHQQARGAFNAQRPYYVQLCCHPGVLQGNAFVQ